MGCECQRGAKNDARDFIERPLQGSYEPRREDDGIGMKNSQT